jgi:micrococcal nuclease
MTDRLLYFLVFVIPALVIGGFLFFDTPRPMEAQVEARAEDMIKVPILEVIDGDSIRMEGAIILYLQGADTATVLKKNPLLRVSGIDTPEILRPKCESERELGYKAKRSLEELIGKDPIGVRGIKEGTWSGRFVAQVLLADGTNAGHALIGKGLAVPYFGRGRRKDWCEDWD